MKTARIFTLAVLTFFATLAIGSCASAGLSSAPAITSHEASEVPSVSQADPPESAPPTPSTAVSPIPESAPPASSAVHVPGFSFEEKTYSKDAIKIKYPQIINMNDGTAQEKLNKLISETALIDVKELETGTEYELNYEVTLNAPTIISIYFDGYGNVPGAAHPYQFLRSVTIDTVSQRTVPLTSLISINEGFVEVMLNGALSSMSYDMTDEYESAIRTYLAESGAEFWTDLLRNADLPSAAVYSYLTEKALVLSVSVPHVMGDHVELVLPFKDLEGYQTDSHLWQEIEK